MSILLVSSCLHFMSFMLFSGVRIGLERNLAAKKFFLFFACRIFFLFEAPPGPAGPKSDSQISG